jgi:hypothetical protein
MEGIPPRSRVRDVIMDRTSRPIDRDVALGMVLEMGYSRLLFLSEEAQSWSRMLGNGLGFVHTPECAQDHYWRLECVDRQWYFQFVDYSPRIQTER